MQAVLGTLRGVLVFVGVAGGLLLLLDVGQQFPLSALQLALQLHQLVVLAVLVAPFDGGRAVSKRYGEGRRCILTRRGGHEVVPAVVAQAGVHRGIVFAGRRQLAVFVEFRRVALAVPVVVALHVVPVVQVGADTLQGRLHLSLGRSAGKGAVIVPRSTPAPLRNPYRALVLIAPVVDVIELVFRPVTMQVDDVATPSARIDRVQELSQEARCIVIVAAIP